MACGVAVVASDRGGVRTAVRDGDTGVLLPRPSVAELERAVAGLLEHPARRAALGARAAAVARERFDLLTNVAALLDPVDDGRRLVRERA
jgi:D-inositol-3-phosphate glycosyltransferase